MSLTRMLKGNTGDCIELKNIISIIDIDVNAISEELVKSPIKAKFKLRDYRLAGQLGTAFDYLARFVIRHYQSKVNGVAYNEVYAAEYGLKALLQNTQNTNNNYKLAYNKGLDIINEYIKGNNTEEIFKRLIGVSVYFAKLELIYRSGYSLDKEQSLRYRIDMDVEEELRSQISIFIDTFEENFKIKTKKSTIYYNPHFSECSIAVGGADADIVINDTLIDFKTSKYLNSIHKDFQQLIGYYLFSKVINAPQNISKICLYFSRYGKFVEYKFTESDEKNIYIAVERMSQFVKERAY